MTSRLRNVATSFSCRVDEMLACIMLYSVISDVLVEHVIAKFRLQRLQLHIICTHRNIDTIAIPVCLDSNPMPPCCE